MKGKSVYNICKYKPKMLVYIEIKSTLNIRRNMSRKKKGFLECRCDDLRQQKRALGKLNGLKSGELVKSPARRRKEKYEKTSRLIIGKLGKVFGPEFREVSRTLTPRFLNKRTSAGSHNLTKGGD